MTELRIDFMKLPEWGPHVLIGPPAAVLRHGETFEDKFGFGFGFVTVVAQIAKPWQRATSWRDETSLDLWPVSYTHLTLPTICSV